MPNRRLTDVERAKLAPLLKSTRDTLDELASGDRGLLFAMRRYVYLRLTYDERGTPQWRRQLKRLKFAEQLGKCANCDGGLEIAGSELHRLDASAGYTVENTQLMHHSCHRAQQEAAHYTDDVGSLGIA